MFLELRGEKWDHPASSRSINGSMPSIIKVFKTSSDERISLSRIFHGRKGRSLVLKTGATLFPCKGRRGSNEGTGETWNSPWGGKRRSSDYHNVIVCLDNRLVVYSSRGETAPPEESRVISSFPFLFSFSFLFFPSFFPSFSLDVCARKSFRVPSRSKRSFYYVPSIIPIISAYFFFFLQQMLRKNLPRRKIVARNYPLNFKIEFNLWSWRFLHIFFSFSFSFWQCVVRGCTPLEKESRDV